VRSASHPSPQVPTTSQHRTYQERAEPPYNADVNLRAHELLGSYYNIRELTSIGNMLP
jgi:hypothetical protein